MRCKRCFGSITDTQDDVGLYDDGETTEQDTADTAALDTDDVTPTQPILFCDACVAARQHNPPPLDVEALFSPSGPLSRPGFEVRPGQVKLARAIYEAAAHQHHLLAEGPCGIGKSKAYGVSAAYLASHGKKVLIVTASIALQEQLIKKDLPALQQELADTFGDWSFAIMKGKSNYVCKESLAVADDNGLSADEREDFKRVMAWARSAPAPRTSASASTKPTPTSPSNPRKSLPVFRGDKSELDFKPSDQVWSRFTTSSEACPGTKCPQFKECYATQARNAAANADVVVTNYHMLFLNISYGGVLLPHADVVMMDEAHEAADIARDLLGFRVSRATFSRYVRDAKKRGATAEAMLLEQAAEAMFSTLLKFYDSGHYAVMLRYPAPFPGLGEELLAAAKAYAAACPKSHLIDHALAAATRVCEGLTLRDPNCVYSIEVSEPSNPQMQHRRAAALQARYVQPGPVLEEKLWAAHDSVIAASATITTDGRFDYARRELGAPVTAVSLAVETPFDFARQALLIVPTANTLTPEPNDPRFGEYVAQLLAATIEACDGRTLGLFTSYKGLRDAYQRITRIIAAWPAAKRPRILQQGDAPPGQLAETFKRDVHSVLLGTTSFWTGIDVPGEALTAVVIDKLPFGSPEDPVTMRLSETSRDTFGQHMVPRAILQFRQGVGRLIRAQSDVGVVVVADKRVVTKGYGARFVRSLPPMAKGVGTRAIPSFLAEAQALGTHGRKESAA